MDMNKKPEIDLSIDGSGNKDNESIKKEENVDITVPEESKDIKNENDDTDGNQNTVNNQISVNDKKAPIIMLFGPRSSGKTMALIRLSRYLRKLSFTIVPDSTFKSDADYREKCEMFMQNIDTENALPGTAYTDFLLLQVSKNGGTICQFLEAPGEHYFDLSNIGVTNFPPYMTQIIRTLPNRKIWVFVAEVHWEVSQKTRQAYINRIRNCKNMLANQYDRFLILYNKIDKREELFKDGHIITRAAETKMRNEFPGLVDVFKNTHPITSLYRSYNYKFVPFCTGYYSKSVNGLTYIESEDRYPKMLWNALLKCIRG